MTTVLAIFGGILLGVLSNELFDVMPWMAVWVLRVAARLDARFDGEAELLFAEWNEQLEHLPGKLTKFVFAMGMLCQVAIARRSDLVRSAMHNGLWAQWLVQNVQTLVAWMVVAAATLTGVLVNSSSIFSMQLNVFASRVDDVVVWIWSVAVSSMAMILSFVFRGRNKLILDRKSRAR